MRIDGLGLAHSVSEGNAEDAQATPHASALLDGVAAVGGLEGSLWFGTSGPNPWDPHPYLSEMRSEAAATLRYTPLPIGTDEATVNARMEELVHFLEAKRDHARQAGGLDQAEGPFRTSATHARRRFFEDLYQAMSDDLAQLAQWHQMPLAVRVGSYDGIAREAQIEIENNINIGYVDRYWTDDELGQLGGALARLPDHLMLENPLTSKLVRIAHLTGDFAGQNDSSGTISISDIAADPNASASYPSAAGAGISALTETVLHELGHNMDDENPRFPEYMQIAGWRRVGDVGSFRDLPNGGAVKGYQVGITDDPNGDYVLMNQSGRGTFVYAKGAEFGASPYGRTNPYEDFAETLAEFLIAPAALMTEAPRKYAFMASFAGARVPADPPRPNDGIGSVFKTWSLF